MLRIIITIIFSLTLCFANGQSVDKLKKDMTLLQARIVSLDNELKLNKRQQGTKHRQQQLLSEKIKTRKQLISDIDKTLKVLRRDIGNVGNSILSHNIEIDSLRSITSRIVVFIYTMEDDYSESLNDYFEYLCSSIYSRMRIVESLIKQDDRRYRSLKRESSKYTNLYHSKRRELLLLNLEINELFLLNRRLKMAEGVLSGRIKGDRTLLFSLQKQIENAIKRELERGFQGVVNNNLSGEFIKNKGVLQSPLFGSSIVDRYGLHNHPTERGVKVNNKGVNLQPRGSNIDIRSIFSGEVRSLFLVNGMGSSIIVRHGNHLTVYSNLAIVNVKVGDFISTGEVLGSLASSSSVLHFELWNETKNLNPEQWIEF